MALARSSLTASSRCFRRRQNDGERYAQSTIFVGAFCQRRLDRPTAAHTGKLLHNALEN